MSTTFTPSHNNHTRCFGDSTLRNGDMAHKFQIFGIGLGRTATHSLNAALNRLGYHTSHMPDLNSRIPLKIALSHYDGGTDSSVAANYKALERTFPTAKFILTVRDKQSWLTSCEQHFQPLPVCGNSKRDHASLRSHLYGATSFDRCLWETNALLHMSSVITHFSGSEHRRSKLLVMNIANGRDGWQQLCQFLHISIDSLPSNSLGTFPHITTESQHLQACEFSDQRMKVGLLYLCKYEGHGNQSNEVWVRRKFMLRDKVAFIFRRPNTPLYDNQWEDAYDLSSATVVKPMSHLTPCGPSFVLRLSGVRRMKNKRGTTSLTNVLVVGLSDIKMLENWFVSFQRCMK